MSRSNLSRLSDHELLGQLNQLVANERSRLVTVLHHLGEVDRRRLHLEMGHRSLFDYCVSRLRYSQSAAGRRIATARVLRRFPDVAPMLESGDVNLTTVSMIAGLLTDDGGNGLIHRIRGKSRQEVERIVAGYRPRRLPRDRVREVCVKVPDAPLLAADTARDRDASGSGAQEHPRGEQPVGPVNPLPEPARPAHTPKPGKPERPRVVHKHEIRFVAGDRFMAKLGRVQALLSNRDGASTFEQVFDAAMDAYLSANCPRRRDQRRRKRAARKSARTDPDATRSTAGGANTTRDIATSPSGRHVPAAVRDAVHVRDRGRCTWVGRDGRRCDARRHLEIDHAVPFGFGGDHTPSNLRLLCRAHNRLAAEHIYGADTMARFARRE